MSITPEQFAAANKATVDSLLSVANTALASAERIAALNLNTARAAQKALAQPAIEKAVAYSRSVYEISTQTQQELAKMVETQFSEFQKSIGNMVDLAAKSAPAGSEGAVAAVQSAIAAANSAFGNMNAMAKQFADVAQKNIAAAMKQGK